MSTSSVGTVPKQDVGKAAAEQPINAKIAKSINIKAYTTNPRQKLRIWREQICCYRDACRREATQHRPWYLRGCGYRGCCSPVCSVVVVVLLFVTFLVVVFIGAAIEKGVFADRSNTDGLYENDRVCGATTGETFANRTAARESAHNESAILNCGDCGACSNEHDIGIYHKTKNTLTDTATDCALFSFLGRSSVLSCYEEEIGFTALCNACWVDNVLCDQRHCKFMCLKMLMLGQRARKNDGGASSLSDCLLCDERMCGPAFLRCAGANRRTAGIMSDIGRLSVQNCDRTGPLAASIAIDDNATQRTTNHT